MTSVRPRSHVSNAFWNKSHVKYRRIKNLVQNLFFNTTPCGFVWLWLWVFVCFWLILEVQRRARVSLDCSRELGFVPAHGTAPLGSKAEQLTWLFSDKRLHYKLLFSAVFHLKRFWGYFSVFHLICWILWLQSKLYFEFTLILNLLLVYCCLLLLLQLSNLFPVFYFCLLLVIFSSYNCLHCKQYIALKLLQFHECRCFTKLITVYVTT